MQKYKLPLLLAVLLIPLISACHPEGREKLKLENSALQQDIKKAQNKTLTELRKFDESS